MAEYTLSEACVLLGISRRTLDYWLQEAGINARNLPTDARKKALTMAQITKLAAAHGKRVKEVESLAGLVVEVAALREQVEALEAMKGQIEALETRLLALETRPSIIRPSIRIPATPAPVQRATGLSSAPVVDPADLADTVKRPAVRPSMPSHALKQGEGARQYEPTKTRDPLPSASSGATIANINSHQRQALLIAIARHGVPAGTSSKWPEWLGRTFPADLAGALRQVLAIQGRTEPYRIKSPLRRCTLADCPCQQIIPAE